MYRFLLLILPAIALSAYNETLAIEYANLAGAAYCRSETLTAWNCGTKCIEPMRDVHVCKGSTTKAFVGHFNGNCVASFEGTTGASSAEVDLDVLTYSLPSHPFECERCWVHKGFYNEWNSLSSCITNSLLMIGCDRNTPLHGTGHSLGAAVVAMGMFFLKAQGWNIVQIYNFGMPRIGNQPFADMFTEIFKGKFFRVTHGLDPFVDMPPGPFFVHVEPEVFYNGPVGSFFSDGYVICHDPFDKRCAAQNFPDFQRVSNSGYSAYHHDYMGVDTTQGHCVDDNLPPCDADIPNSWCAYFPACNKDTRGKEVYCHYGSPWKGGLGKCHCHEGYCPNREGRCVPKSEVNRTPSPAPEHSSAGISLNADTGISSLTLIFGGILVSMPIAVAGIRMAYIWRYSCYKDAQRSNYHLLA